MRACVREQKWRGGRAVLDPLFLFFSFILARTLLFYFILFVSFAPSSPPLTDRTARQVSSTSSLFADVCVALLPPTSFPFPPSVGQQNGLVFGNFVFLIFFAASLLGLQFCHISGLSFQHDCSTAE